MKRASEGLGPVVTLDRRLALSLHRQLYDAYREAILEGRLRPGQRLPSTRILAVDLRVSRIPVTTPFEQLLAEGYIESRVGAGSYVSARLPDSRPTARTREEPTRRQPRRGTRRMPPSVLEER